MKEIRVKIKGGKQVEVTTAGFGGESCRAATQELERRLGGKVLSDENTDDFYAVTENVDVKAGH